MMLPTLPFQTRISHFRLPNKPCRLPFALGSAMQHHKSSLSECHNSQDAVSMIISPERIVAVLADGCFGTHSSLESSSNSSNEVGAKLLSYVITNFAAKIIAERPKISERTFVNKLSEKVHKTFRSLLCTFCGIDSSEKKLFAYDFLMATALGFVVSDTRFIVFYTGNGVITINGKINVMDDEDGKYITNDLIKGLHGERKVSQNNAIKIFRSGCATELQSIFLASDGFACFASNHPDSLREFALAKPEPGQVENGFDFLLQEFRQRIAWNPELAPALDDDTTFLMLRRTA